jgi:hypothetical protein
VPARWIRAVIQIESGGDEHAISPRGAMGLMQLMPGTWVELGVRYGFGLDPFDPTAYLREMHDRFGSAGFLAAYHAGPSRYEHHLATGQPLPPDTVAYVAAVTPLLGDEHGERTAFAGRRAVPWRQSPLTASTPRSRKWMLTSVMLQHAPLASSSVFHAKTAPAELSLHPLNKINRNDCIAFSREWLRTWEVQASRMGAETSDRGGRIKPQGADGRFGEKQRQI